MFVDDEGTVLNGSITTQIFAKDILRRKKGKVVASLDCSYLLEKAVKELGGQFVWSKVGHTYIEDNMAKGALLAGEMSSHFYFGIYGELFSDGILSTLIMGKIIEKEKERGGSLSFIVSQMPKNYLVHNRIDCPNDKKSPVIEKIKESIPSGYEILSEKDGVKLSRANDESVLVRPSNTESKIKITAESPSNKRGQEICDYFSSLVKNVVSSL
jgi:phosphomannomutase